MQAAVSPVYSHALALGLLGQVAIEEEEEGLHLGVEDLLLSVRAGKLAGAMTTVRGPGGARHHGRGCDSTAMAIGLATCPTRTARDSGRRAGACMHVHVRDSLMLEDRADH